MNVFHHRLLRIQLNQVRVVDEIFVIFHNGLPIKEDPVRTSCYLSSIFACFIFMIIFGYSSAYGQAIEDLKAGVVKITAEGQNQSKIGSGIIIRLGKRQALILTASHVIEGSQNIKVSFFKENQNFYPATVFHMEGGDPKGLGLLKVEGHIPEGLQPLSINPAEHARAGENVLIIGHPRILGVSWMVAKGFIGGLDGRLLGFSGDVEEGSSGGPLILNNEVIGIIVEKIGPFGRAVPAGTIRTTLASWLINLNPVTSRNVNPASQQPPVLEGFTCEVFKGTDTLGNVREEGLKKALYQSILSYRKYWEATAKVPTFRLREDFLEGISSNLLRNIQLVNQEFIKDKEGTQVCFFSSAELKLESLQEYVQKRDSSRKIAEETQKAPLIAKPDFRLRLRTNKEDERIFEGDTLEIFVESDVEAYLKVDYFTADGSVAHIVPRPGGEQVLLPKGEVVDVNERLGIEMRISPPFGTEMIEACASTKPIPRLQPGKFFDDAKRYAQSRTRGISIVPEGDGEVREKASCASLKIQTLPKAS